MKRKVKVIIVAAVMILTMMPSAAFAASQSPCTQSPCAHEAAIGEVHYDKFSEAVAAAQDGNTITLLKNVTMDKTYFGAEAGQSRILDLNGFTLTRTWQDWVGDDTTTKSVIYNKGALTIRDSSAAKTGKIQGYSDTSGSSGWNQEFKGAAISNAVGATINLEGATITRGDKENYGFYTVYNKGTINMSGGLIVNGSNSSSLVCNVEGGSDFTMTGGTLSQKSFQALKNEPGSTVEISGGTIESGDRALQNYGTATVTNGTLNGNIQIPAGGMLTITKGVINGKLFGDGSAEISGGTFSQAVPEEFCAPNFVPTQNADGSFGVIVPERYDITVIDGTVKVNGIDAKDAIAGDNVSITANAAPKGKTFDKWVITGADTSGMDVTKAELTFTMPASDVTATATYKNAAADGDNSPGTGDETNMAIWIALIAITTLAGAGTVLYKRKNTAE